MKINYQMELTRRDVTPAQFLAYVRSQAKKHDITFGMELDYFTKGDGSDSHYIGGTPATRPCESETCKALPFDHQAYMRAFDGSVYNEIIEFTYDTETTGHGYYYTISADGEPSDAERIKTSTINFHFNTAVRLQASDEFFARHFAFAGFDLLRFAHALCGNHICRHAAFD